MIYNSSDDKIYLTASSYYNKIRNDDIFTIKFDTSGNPMWVNYYNYSLKGNSSDIPTEIVSNGAAGVYVTGTSDDTNNVSQIVNIGYDTSGAVIFTERWGDSNLGESISAGIDTRFGNKIASGGYFFNGKNYDYITLLYNETGILQWSKAFNGNGNGNDFLSDLKIDNFSNLMVTGSSYTDSVNNYDYATIKYLANGDSGWVNIFNGEASGNDSAVAILVDGFNCSFVTGKSMGLNGNYSYGSILYNTSGIHHWFRFFQSAELSGDNIPIAMVKSKFSNSFAITGSVIGASGNAFNSLVYGGIIDGLTIIDGANPEGYNLFQNYPNPFNPVTKIKFAISHDSRGETQAVKLVIYDGLGRELKTLVNQELSPGSYETVFNGTDLASGVYFYKLSATDGVGSFVETKRMILLK